MAGDPVLDEETVRLLESDYAQATLKPADRAMLDYAVKLTESPAAMTEADLQELHHHGFTEEDILEIIMMVAYFNFSNRYVSAMGIPVPQE